MKLLLLQALIVSYLLAQQFPTVRLVPVATGLQSPTDVAAIPDGSGRLVVLEQRGFIRLIRNGSLQSTPFLDWSRRVGCCGERGLLGIAFPPGFSSKQYFYLNYTDTQGNTVISRVRISADPNRADPNSEQMILQVAQPFSNHNGGQIVFGPDGYLYIGMGDGGGGGDPQNNAQRGGTLLGKMLRIDTESGTAPYAVPSTNPFVGRSDYRGEIYATGLRNPWRFSFDRETRDLWIADVGQGRAEEVNFTPASSSGGENYGWSIMEGLQCYPPSDQTCNRQGLTLPILEYTRDLGQSVTGGFVYRGSRFPALRGIYFYADFGSGRLWGVRRSGEGWENWELLNSSGFSTFGQDENGELYVASYSGTLYLLATGAPTISTNGIVNAASYGPGLVPGSLATIFGSGITSFSGIIEATAFPIPTQLAGTSVTVNGTPVPVLAVANVNGQEQINFQVPFDLTGGSEATVVVNANGQQSSPMEVRISSAQPEIFALTRTSNTITIWATGLGQVTNAPATGQAAPVSPLANTVATTEVTVGGMTAPVLYSGLAPTYAGLYQINATLPEGVAADAPVVLRVGSGVSQPWPLSNQ